MFGYDQTQLHTNCAIAYDRFLWCGLIMFDVCELDDSPLAIKLL